MPNMKKYILTAVTLGAIAMASGLLIGATNLVTADKIAQNNENKINDGVQEIYGVSASIKEKETVDNDDYKYVTEKYVVNSNDILAGYAFKTEGSNSYGKVSLIIGFSAPECNFVGLSIITNEQTYAPVLVEFYIDPLNKDKDVEGHDVKCGATYGAKLVRAMIDEAKKAAKEL